MTAHIGTPLPRVALVRVGPGRYRVPSSRLPGVAYSVQVAGERGVCDCLGAEGAYRNGNQCRHIRECIAEERKHSMTNSNQESTAVAVREHDDYQVVQYNPTLPTMDELKVITTMANHFYKLSGKMIPASIKSSEEAFAVMIAGREWGLGPMESFANMHVINGTVSPGYRVLSGAVLRGDPQAIIQWKCKPDCKAHADGRHLERTPTRAAARLTRGNGMTLEVEYTMEDAKRAGLAGKDNYQKNPTDMLCSKVVVRLCRLGGPDLITRLSASVKGAPAVMRAVEEAIDADADEMPALDQTALPAETAPEPAAKRERQTRSQHQTAPADGRTSAEPAGDTPKHPRAQAAAALWALAEACGGDTTSTAYLEAIVPIQAKYPKKLDATGTFILSAFTDMECGDLTDALTAAIAKVGA